jgi:hypothetical protein
VTAAVEALEHALDRERDTDVAETDTDTGDGREVVVTVGDRRVTLPAPDAAVARTDTGMLGGPVTIELTWSPRESE